MLLDTLGELEGVYAVADIIFVGGSLVPVGGHNILEAAAFGKPVFFGPHMANFKEIADQLLRSGGGIEVKSGEDLGQKMTQMLSHPEEMKKRGEAAHQVVMNNQGAVNRNLNRISKWLTA